MMPLRLEPVALPSRVKLSGHRLLFQNNIVFLSVKIIFILANSADPDEMLHSVPFYLGFHCLQKYPFRGFKSTKGKVCCQLILESIHIVHLDFHCSDV